MDLLGDAELERSAVVANCRMNRERGLTGSNGYDREVGFDPLARATEHLAAGHPFRWLDLCCGTGKALIEAARLLPDERFTILGVDLVGRFAPGDPLPSLALVEAALSTWTPAPDQRFDLITCVHGLHYIGDKLDLITRAASWLTDDGPFVATLDLTNLQVATGSARHQLWASFRRAGLDYDQRRRLIRCQGHRWLDLPYRYRGADPSAGPNYTGQPAVTSVYELIPDCPVLPSPSRMRSSRDPATPGTREADS